MQTYPTDADAQNAILGLESYYKQHYSEFYAANPGLITDAIKALQGQYSVSSFIDQKMFWNTHPDNVGHELSPGCFRCHDGKHLTAGGEAIRLECNLCHSIPVVTKPGDIVTRIELSRGVEPPSHLNTNWITIHNQVFDGTCQTCHTVENPGGKDNTSFCSNSACHGSSWNYAGFDAPQAAGGLKRPDSGDTTHPHCSGHTTASSNNCSRRNPGTNNGGNLYRYDRTDAAKASAPPAMEIRARRV